MRKTMTIGLILTLTAAACGGAGDSGTGDGEIDETPDAGVVAPATTPQAPVTNDGADLDPPTTSETAPRELETMPPVTDADVGTTVAPPGGSTGPPEVNHPNPQVAIALGDLVARVSVDPEEITVVSIEEVMWSDGSLGCPQPDMSYTQALVDGNRIVLRIAGVDYAYHSGGRREPFYCKNPVDPVDGDFGDA